MACTDRHCRYFLRLMSPHALLYSEMVVCDALIHGDTLRFLGHAADEPVALQLGGSDPEKLVHCSKLAEANGYQEVNLNVGCPSDRVQVGGIGACLMAEAKLVAECFQAMQQAVSIPVTIKSRIGINDQDSYEFFESFISTLYAADCRTFIVHARAAILEGLTPRENRDIPPLKYDYVHRIQQQYPDAVFVLNGGLKSVQDVMTHQGNAKGVMLGRAIYDNPWLLADLEAHYFDTPTPTESEVLNGIRDYMIAQLGSDTALKHMTKHLFGLFNGQPGARAYRRTLSENMFAENADITIFDEAVAQVNRSPNFRNAS